MKKRENIWVVCAEGSRQIGEHSFQLIHIATQLQTPDIPVHIAAVCIGGYSKNQIDELFAFGAEEIIKADLYGPAESDMPEVLAAMVKHYSPNLILFPATPLGRVCASTLAVVIGAGLTADCLALRKYPSGGYLFSRIALSDSVMAHIVCTNTSTQMCTVRKNVMTAHRLSKVIPGCITTFDREAAGIHIIRELTSQVLLSKPLDKDEDMGETDSLEKAKLVFAYGRGLKGDEALRLLYETAEAYGAIIAGTRPIIEEGLLNRSRQVGQSGISIAPHIYIAFGVSGASQHMVGVKNARCVIAVNTDEQAPIFSYANYAIVEDCCAILRQLLAVYQRTREVALI